MVWPADRQPGANGKLPLYQGKMIARARSNIINVSSLAAFIPGSIVYSNCWRGYNVLDVADFKHFRIKYSKHFADKRNHITALRIFGTRRSVTCGNSMGFPRNISPGF